MSNNGLDLKTKPLSLLIPKDSVPMINLGSKGLLTGGFILSHTRYYPVQLHISYIWSFGFLAFISILIQIITGLLLSMHYTPTLSDAYNSIQYIMRDVQDGWFVRYTHMNGASGLFVVLYCHILRGIYYKSYKAPRVSVWISGMFLYVGLMATAFTGYILPWGQMSLWGATVIINLLSIVPLIGDNLVLWLLGGPTITDATLQRFFTIHYLLPFIIFGGALLHIILLHKVGSSDPLGSGESKPVYLNFYPNVVIKDIVAFWVYITVLMYYVHFDPLKFAHPENLIRANILVTPPHIVPEWYFLPFYAILRAIPNKTLGILTMFGSIIILFILPYIDKPLYTGTSFKPIYICLYWLWLNIDLLLGWLGSKPVEYPYDSLGLICTLLYFFLIFLICVHTRYENKFIFR